VEELEARELLTFQHPGLLLSQADINRAQSKVTQGAGPWLSGWNTLVNDPWSHLGQNPAPLAHLVRGGSGSNYGRIENEIKKTWATTLRWVGSGDTRYADQAVRFLNAWQYTMTSISGDADRFLAAGVYGNEWANIAEIMRSYPGWAAADVANCQNWLLTIWYPMSHDFLVHHNGAVISNYWANWDLCDMANIEAIGVFCDRQDLYNEAINYFYHGAGNGAIDKLVYYVHDGYLGQGQESGRDQGHSTLDLSLMGAVMQMAWNQGDDLFGYENNKFLMVAEYINKYNLGYDVPFETYSWESGPGNGTGWNQQTVVSSGSRGSFRPDNELIYNHYVNVLGLAAPYTTAARNSHSPEGASGNSDELGFGTLIYSRGPVAPGVTPSGLTAKEVSGGVTLNWWGEPYATSYNVYRSTDGVNFTQIASNLTGPLSYTDQPGPGVYFYEVTANEPGGETAPSNVVQGATVATLHTQLLFNESGGTTAYDASGNGNNGTLMNGATFTGSSVYLNSSQQQYVSLPTGLVSNLADFTIAAWVNLASNNTWSRIFDFGDSNGRYMFLTPRASSGKVRFAFGLNYGWNELDADGTAALPTNQWVHVAVTRSGSTVTLYVNGVAVGSRAQDFQPFQLGNTVNTWIGRSQYGSGPYLNGQVSDFRIYHCALSAGGISQLSDISTLAAASPVANGTYTLTNLASNLVMDDPGASHTSGTQIIQWTPNGANNQKWVFTYNGHGYHTIRNLASGLYLTESGTSNGAQLQQRTADSQDDQLWSVVWINGGFLLINKASGLAADDPGSSTTVGQGLDLWAVNDGRNQIWQFS
jgi:hypothetical protein